MSATCYDCGIETAPCTEKRGCRHADRWEYYTVDDDLWKDTGMNNGYLCIKCLEHRIGRRLNSDDFPDWPINRISNWDTPRLRAAKARPNPYAELEEVMQAAP